jgi:hypothetical protein
MGLHELAERGAHLRAHAARAADRAAFAIDREQRDEFGGVFRLRHQLGTEDALRSWRDQNGLKEADFSELMTGEMTLQWFRTLYADRADRHLKQEMLACGYYGSVRKRANHKQTVLADRGLSSPELKDAGLSLEELLGWYIHSRLKQPAAASAASVLHQLGVRNLEEFTREALREYLYLELLAEKASGDR